MRAPSSRLQIRRESDSPLKGWRECSLETLWRTSDINSAVKSLISLCRMVGKAPLKACSMVLDLPQAQLEGGGQP